MSAVFEDTFFWIAFTNVQDQAHERAKSFSGGSMDSSPWAQPLVFRRPLDMVDDENIDRGLGGFES